MAWSDPIFTAVVSEPGKVAPIPARLVRPIDPSSTQVFDVSVVWTGSHYLMTWVENTANTAVMVATLDRAGALRSAPHHIDDHAATWNGAMAWNGKHALLIEVNSDTSKLSGVLLDADGNVVRRDISIPDLTSFIPMVTAANDTFFIFRSEGQNVAAMTTPPPPTRIVTSFFGVRLNDSGDAIDAHATKVATIDGTATPAAFAFDGHTLAMAFLTHDSPGPTLLRRVFIDPNSFAATALPDVVVNGFRVTMVRTGSAFVALWVDPRATGYMMMSLPFAGTDAFTPNMLFAARGGAGDVAATWTGRHLLVASDPFVVSYGLVEQLTPGVANGLVLWGDATRDGQNAELFASLTDAGGTPIGSPIRLSTGGDVDVVADSPQAVFTGWTWFVIRNEQIYAASSPAKLMARRLRADGTPIDAAPIDLGISFARSLAFNGNAMDTITIGKGVSAAVASNGHDFLFVWSVGSDWWQFPSANMLDVLGARLTESGTVLDSAPINIATGPDDQIAPSVASNGSDYLVAYFVRGAAAQPINWQMAAQRVSRDGFAAGAPVIVGDASQDKSGAISGDAGGYSRGRDRSRSWRTPRRRTWRTRAASMRSRRCGFSRRAFSRRRGTVMR